MMIFYFCSDKNLISLPPRTFYSVRLMAYEVKYLGLILWVINLFLMNYLSNFSGQMNFLGILNHLLYNRLGLDPILSFFTFFIIGTVIGEIIFEIYLIEDRKERKFILKKKLDRGISTL